MKLKGLSFLAKTLALGMVITAFLHSGLKASADTYTCIFSLSSGQCRTGTECPDGYTEAEPCAARTAAECVSTTKDNTCISSAGSQPGSIGINKYACTFSDGQCYVSSQTCSSGYKPDSCTGKCSSATTVFDCILSSAPPQGSTACTCTQNTHAGGYTCGCGQGYNPVNAGDPDTCYCQPVTHLSPTQADCGHIGQNCCKKVNSYSCYEGYQKDNSSFGSSLCSCVEEKPDPWQDIADNLVIAKCDVNGEEGIPTAIGCIPTTLKGFSPWILRWFIGLSGGIAFLLIVYAAFQIISAAGNPQQVQAGQELLTSAITGLIFIIGSLFLLKLVGIEILAIPGLS